MNIRKARAFARLIGLLHKLDIVTSGKADRLVDILTVRCLKNPDDI